MCATILFNNSCCRASTQQLTVTVDAGYQARLGSETIPFTFVTGTCAGFTGPGTCVMTGTFAPTAAGVASDTFVMPRRSPS